MIIKSQRIKQEQIFSYFRMTVNEDWNHSLKIKCKIERTKEAFRKMSKLFGCRNLSPGIKIGLLWCSPYYSYKESTSRH